MKMSISALKSCNADMLILAMQPRLSRKKSWSCKNGPFDFGAYKEAAELVVWGDGAMDHIGTLAGLG